MILSDNETKLDMLNNISIAKTIVSIIFENQTKPISIGVHGDWGAGKSSILEMIEEELKSKKEVACVKFNGWKHQGFEDAKIALMETIVAKLISERSLTTKAADTVKKIWKSINWLKVAKCAGSLAITTFTGIPPVGLVKDALGILNNTIKEPEKISETINKLGDFFKDEDSKSENSITKDFEEFQKSFKELMEKADISQLVVLIDDLDRCLPEVTIETLEAIRLFLFSNSTAFVIAADEVMIEYAVKKHFPDLPENQLAKEFSRKYLEKLIQVPLKIPTLGELEAKTYILLLLISSEFKEEDKNFKELIEFALEKIKQPWLNQSITINELQQILKENYTKVSEQVIIANQISTILARGAAGNPRQIKRFINTLLLRYRIASERGLDIRLAVLAKLMLVERFLPPIYEEIAKETSEDGICKPIKQLESILHSKSDMGTREIGEIEEAKQEDLIANKWAENKELCEWARIEPSIGDYDLRPYYFASKERKDYFFNQIQSEFLREKVQSLLGSKMYVTSLKNELSNLTKKDAEYLFDLVTQKIISEGSFNTMPKGIEGLRVLVETHHELEGKLAKFISILPFNQVGAWVCSGWDKCIISDQEKDKLKQYLKDLSNKGNETVKTIAKAILGM